MVVSVKDIAKDFSTTEEEVIYKGLDAFLHERLRFCNAEKLALCKKYGVSSLAEMDSLIKEGNVDEEEILADFQRVDFLTSESKKLRKMLDKLA